MAPLQWNLTLQKRSGIMDHTAFTLKITISEPAFYVVSIHQTAPPWLVVATV